MRLLAILLATVVVIASTPATAKKHRGKSKKKAKHLDTEVVLPDRIQIRVHGIQSSQGWVICRLYDKKGWLKKAKKSVSANIERRAAVCIFEGIKPGTYAVAAFHDENRDGEIEDDGTGGPLEGVCTSNNWPKLDSKPPFDKARFTYPGGTITKSAKMLYRRR